ncbi:iron-only hydrogenase maturation protein HydE [Anaerovirgula multivorans]|uniref:Iron-only hydrogenase maturation protein HydE n=1 Tax=Anaerovirgula multivorans TaxID=312168 RepID=A0A239BNF5_9FIRM|nr:[FeFe] hydrogenase H-cluster radical SAM maturase HydE [Anaerovirgula multivorans]SNS09657.1 iron-only hydrogenase maturation protein HydE [Anaerovirgula multivorans]
MSKELIERLYRDHYLTREELVALINHLDDEGKKLLFHYSLQTKIRHYGKKVFMRGLIEFSNYCKQDCLYCGIRASNKKVERYRLSINEILQCCNEGYRLGYRTFVLQSGEDFWYGEDKLISIVKKIKGMFPDTAVTLSIGERGKTVYQKLFEAGTDRFLLRHETASKSLYEKLHPTMDFKNRRTSLNTLKKIGYQVGAGFMVGLPGQTAEDLAEDLHFLKELSPDMIGIGPFIPHGETPLRDAVGGSLEDTLVMVALARLMIPEALLPATTALGTLDPNGREKAILAGANVVMPNLSPTKVRPLYELYENKICTGDEPAHCRGCIEQRITSTGMEVDLGRGDSIQFQKNNSKFA